MGVQALEGTLNLSCFIVLGILGYGTLYEFEVHIKLYMFLRRNRRIKPQLCQIPFFCLQGRCTSMARHYSPIVLTHTNNQLTILVGLGALLRKQILGALPNNSSAFFELRFAQSKKRSQTKFSLRPTFPSYGLQGRHEWPLNCCLCGENNWAVVSCF